nr:MAG TPA: hypothetical protein [Caudoviricetes sp.]
MGDDIPMMKLVLRGFVGARQVREHAVQVESQSAAWEYVSAYFKNWASWSECDRYTVDTYWVY